MDITITENLSGRTLLSYLKFTLKISSACIAKLKRDEHGLEVNKSHVTVRYILKTGDILHINIDDNPEDTNKSILPVKMPIDIIYEDNDIIVVNKPPYMPTHPSHNHHDDTLANAIAYLYLERNIPFVFRPVGRLDRNTSGIVALAKSMPAASHFTRERENNNIRKSYIAILVGETNLDGGVIDTPLRRQSDSIIIRTVCGEGDVGAMKAVTVWKRLYSGNGITLVTAYPKTGRTHQIRVHFASVGNPILGDDLYGSKSEYIQRHALHAYSVFFTLPFSDKAAEAYAEIPEDMQNAFYNITGKSIYEYIDTVRGSHE